MFVQNDIRLFRAERHRRSRVIAGKARNLPRTLRMDETSARHNDLAYLAQIFSALHEGLPKHGIRFFERTGVARHGSLHGHGGNCVIEPFQFRVVLRQRLRIVREQLHERLHPLRRKPESSASRCAPAAANTPSME